VESNPVAVAAEAKPAERAEAAENFTDDEEAFFQRGSEIATRGQAGESFEDLDEDYDMPRTFWQRFFTDPNAPLKRSQKYPVPPRKVDADKSDKK
jgi:hypothetical protein